MTIQQNHPTLRRDQRGVAMVFELLLVAVVLTLVGVAIYQVNHRAPVASTTSQTGAQPNSANGLAASATALSEQAAATDASLSAAADSSVDDVTASDTTAANLENSSNASF